MTAFGKILVFVTVALSLAMATWAFAVWSNRIDFSNTRARGEQAAGEYEQRAAAIAQLWEAVPPAELAWRTARRELADREERRLTDRVWYQAELDHLRNKATADNPGRLIVYADKD